jgi:hypothetical protein
MVHPTSNNQDTSNNPTQFPTLSDTMGMVLLFLE